MPLASRIILVLFIVFVCFALVDFLIQRQVVYRSFLDLERREAHEDLRRCVEALQREVEHLRLLCNDWAAWDATYEFVAGGAPGYIAANLLEESFTDNHLDLIYVCDRAGRVVWGRAWDRARGAPVSMPEFPPDRLPAGHPLGPDAAMSDGVAGTWATSRGPMLVAAQPILTSANLGPARGVLIMGRLLDGDLIEVIGRQARVKLRAWPARADAVPAETRPALEMLREAQGGAAATSTRERLLLHTLVADVEGRPGLLLRADVPREITRRGRIALNYASASVLQVGLLILCVALVMLRRSVITPIVALTERVTGFAAGGERTPERDRAPRRNELDTLTAEFDNMTRQVTEARARLLQQATELERANAQLQRDIEARSAVEAELRTHEHRLRALASELTLTEQRERRRIAELLHDEIGQALAMAKLSLQDLHQQTPAAGQAEALANVIGVLDQVIARCRSLTFDLSPPVLHELGLEAALEWLAEATTERGLSCEFHDDGRDRPLAEEARLVLFNAARELVTNVMKHARAARATLSIAREGDRVLIVVSDDGIGFQAAPGASGFGLFNIRERLGHFDGTLTIETPTGGGARVTLALPLNGRGHAQEADDHADEDNPGG